jgi:DNA-binding transcriptional LysR family regulator
METIASYLPELIGFYYVAKTGGFTRAAEKLNLSKSQLSKQVSALEVLLQTQLFFRSTRKIKLTSEGQNLLHYAEKIILASEEAFLSTQELVKREMGTFKITAPPSLGDWFAPTLLSIMSKELPQISICFDFSNERKNLIDHNFDFAVRAMDEKDPNLVARYIGHIRDVVCVAPGVLRPEIIKKINSHPESLSKEICILNSFQSKWNTWRFQKGNQDYSIEVNGTYACAQYTTAKSLCIQKVGIARIPLYLVESELREKELIQLLTDYQITTHPLYLVYPSKNYRTQAQKKFADLFLAWFAKQSAFKKI